MELGGAVGINPLQRRSGGFSTRAADRRPDRNVVPILRRANVVADLRLRTRFQVPIGRRFRGNRQRILVRRGNNSALTGSNWRRLSPMAGGESGFGIKIFCGNVTVRGTANSRAPESPLQHAEISCSRFIER